jgi:CubicO group peptidase (beta-lactamase class C family)
LEGKARGVQLLKPETVELIFDEQANGTDLVIPAPLRWGIGYALAKTEALPYVPDEKICFCGGWGGSMVLMCPDRRATIAYVMNKMGPGILGSERTATYATLIFDALASVGIDFEKERGAMRISPTLVAAAGMTLAAASAAGCTSGTKSSPARPS